MKSTIVWKESEPQNEYPKIVIYSGGPIVLLHSPRTGIAISPGEGCNIGDYNYDWDMDTAEHFTGQVVLEN